MPPFNKCKRRIVPKDPCSGTTMDFDMLASSDSLEKLKCTTCKNYLSHFPIYASADKNICGRCPPPEQSLRNEVYEALSQLVEFSCRYKNEGCVEKFSPKNMPGHEKTCPFRIINCPAADFTECKWTGPRPTSLHHCQDKHFDWILKDGVFEMDLSHSHQHENLLEYNNMLFIVSRKYYSINKLLEFSVCNIEGEVSGAFSCHINFESAKRSVSVQFQTTPYDDRSVTEVFLDSLRDGSDCLRISGKISLEKIANQGASSVNEKINEDLLAQLKCSVCSEYALPPIYQYMENQIRCSVCRDKFQRIGEIRNFNLDKMANLLNYPCKNQKSGCGFVLKPEEMKKHQIFCPHGNHDCPVGEYTECKWNGFGKDVIVHTQENHNDMIKKSSEISECVLNLNNIFSSKTSNYDLLKCYVFKFSDCLFRLSFAVVEQNYCWTMQTIGHFRENFKYEIEIINKNNRLLLRRPCSPLTKKDQLFTEKNEYCYFNNDQIGALLTGPILTYKVRIFK